MLLRILGPEIATEGIHLSVWAIVPLGAALAALFGALLGAPTLKLRGDYLAVVTLGFGEIIRIFIINLNAPVPECAGQQILRHLVEPLQRHVFGQVVIESEVLRQLLLGLAMVLIMLTRPGGLMAPLLDNIVWHTLAGPHAKYTAGSRGALRIPFAAICRPPTNTLLKTVGPAPSVVRRAIP